MGQLQSIVTLQETQLDLDAARERLEGIPDWMRDLHEQHAQRKSEIDAVGAAREEADRTRRQAEAELADAQERAKRFQEQIGQVSTQREYAALLKEIDTVKEQIRQLEQRALEALEQSEDAQRQLGELTEAFKDLDERYQTELSKWEEEKPSVAAQVDELSRREDQLRAKLPRSILVLYDRIRERYGHAVSRIVRIQARGSANAMWHCEACSYNVRPQIVIEIRNDGSFVQCDGCKRILYWSDDSGEP